MAALDVFARILAEKSISAFRFATELGAGNLISLGTEENAANVGVLIALFHSSIVFTVEDFAVPSVVFANCHIFALLLSRLLNCLSVAVIIETRLVSENIGVLVGCALNLG